MFNKGISLRFWGSAITLILLLTACSPATKTQVGGNVQGSVPANLSTPSANPISSPIETLTETMAVALSATDTPTSKPTDTVPSAPNLAGLILATDQDVNCRVGPDMVWLAVGALKKGQSAAVLGTNNSHSWWVIDNSFYLPGTTCWVSGAVTNITGEVTSAPVLPTPSAWVTSVQISTAKVVHGICGMSNTATFEGAITTNGPATVTFHWVIFTTNGILLKQTSDQQLVFTSYGTKNVDPGSYSTDCGDYYIELIVTSPNSKVKQKFWSVVSP
jgi:hypothetical protein